LRRICSWFWTRRSAVAVAWPDVIGRLIRREDLSEQLAEDVLREVMSGGASPAQVAGFLVALRAKGETGQEIAGLVRAMVGAAEKVEVDGPLVDTCGTGGDGAGTFNISTCAALVVAAAGVRVAKHGNRAASGRCGSADVLEAWGVVIDLPPDAVARCLAEVGIGFMFARRFHPAMRHVAAVRSELGVPTVFNVLGPLTNPAGAQHQVVGVADPRLAPVIADALVRLGRARAMVVRGDDGTDELTTTGPNRVWEVADGRVTESVVDPAALGLARATLADLQGGDVAESAAIGDAVLAGEAGPRADVVALNAAAALLVAGAAADLAAGLERARAVLASGAARDLRDRWAALTRELAEVPTP